MAPFPDVRDVSPVIVCFAETQITCADETLENCCLCTAPVRDLITDGRVGVRVIRALSFFFRFPSPSAAIFLLIFVFFFSSVASHPLGFCVNSLAKTLQT